MQPRDHHFGFAKKLLPNEVFRSPDRMFAELTGPKREAFLMYLGQGRAGAPPSGMPNSAGRAAVSTADLLEKVVLARAAFPIFIIVVSRLVGAFLGPIWGVINILRTLFSLGVFALLLAWLFQIYNSRRDKLSHTPEMAIAWWFIPVANFAMPAVILRDAWNAVVGPVGSEFVFIWWGVFLLNIAYETLYSFMGFVRDSMLIVTVLSYGGTILTIATYGLLWHIVKTINAKL